AERSHRLCVLRGADRVEVITCDRLERSVERRGIRALARRDETHEALGRAGAPELAVRVGRVEVKASVVAAIPGRCTGRLRRGQKVVVKCRDAEPAPPAWGGVRRVEGAAVVGVHQGAHADAAGDAAGPAAVDARLVLVLDTVIAGAGATPDV